MCFLPSHKTFTMAFFSECWRPEIELILFKVPKDYGCLVLKLLYYLLGKEQPSSYKCNPFVPSSLFDGLVISGTPPIPLLSNDNIYLVNLMSQWYQVPFFSIL
jgi:hypothetical protein